MYCGEKHYLINFKLYAKAELILHRNQRYMRFFLPIQWAYPTPVMSKIELAWILVIMSVLTFKTAVILYIFWWRKLMTFSKKASQLITIYTGHNREFLEIYIICVIEVLDRIYNVTFLSHINPKLGMQHYIP